MVLPRTSAFGRMFRPSATRTAKLRSAAQAWRTAGRRTYASDHGPAKKSSDLFWMIGSVAVTVPSATWLLQQGPKKGDHGHGHDEHAEHEEAEEVAAEAKDEGSSEKPTDDGEAKSEDGGKDDSGEKDESSESEDGGGKQTPPTSDDDDGSEDQGPKGKGEKQKRPTRPKTQTQEEKMKAKDVSGAANPNLADAEKSKKGEGVKASAKIEGTVDTGRKIRGSGDGKEDKHMVGNEQKDNPAKGEA